MKPSFWKPRRPVLSVGRWYVERIDARGLPRSAENARGRLRTFIYFEGASEAASRLNDEIGGEERQALLASGERP